MQEPTVVINYKTPAPPKKKCDGAFFKTVPTGCLLWCLGILRLYPGSSGNCQWSVSRNNQETKSFRSFPKCQVHWSKHYLLLDGCLLSLFLWEEIKEQGKINKGGKALWAYWKWLVGSTLSTSEGKMSSQGFLFIGGLQGNCGIGQVILSFRRDWSNEKKEGNRIILQWFAVWLMLGKLQLSKKKKKKSIVFHFIFLLNYFHLKFSIICSLGIIKALSSWCLWESLEHRKRWNWWLILLQDNDPHSPPVLCLVVSLQG